LLRIINSVLPGTRWNYRP